MASASAARAGAKPAGDAIAIADPTPPRTNGASPTGAPADSHASGIIGLSGLSEMMRQSEGAAPGAAKPPAPGSSARPTPGTPGATPASAPRGRAAEVGPLVPGPQARQALAAARRRHRKMLVSLLAVLAVLVGILGTAIAFLAASAVDDEPPQPAVHDHPAPDPADTPGPVSDD